MLGASLESDCRGNLCWLFSSKSEDWAKRVRVQAALPVSDSDRRLGGHPISSCEAKDLQDGPQIMASGNGPNRD